jgi:hypothetical protein
MILDILFRGSWNDLDALIATLRLVGSPEAAMELLVTNGIVEEGFVSVSARGPE